MGSCLKSQFIINNLLIYVQLASGTRKMHDIILHVYALLWNQFYSFGPKFVDYQVFAGSWGRHFINNWFVALPCKTIQNTGKRAWGCKDVAKLTPKSTTFYPQEQWRFHSIWFHLNFSYLFLTSSTLHNIIFISTRHLLIS